MSSYNGGDGTGNEPLTNGAQGLGVNSLPVPESTLALLRVSETSAGISWAFVRSVLVWFLEGCWRKVTRRFFMLHTGTPGLDGGC